MSTQEERLALLALMHAQLAVANATIAHVAQMLGVDPAQVDPLTLTDSDIDTYIDMIDKEAKS